jgi:RNA polymerase sigma-70 factor, ECF subfamily
LEPQQLAKLVETDNNEARRTLFEAYYRRTFAVAYNILRNRESAEDITQDAFIKAFQSIHQLKDSSKFGAWLSVIASNLARNYLKRGKKVVYSDELPEGYHQPETVDTESEALKTLEVERVRRAIKDLSADHYQVIVLQFYHDLKVDEIADLLKISPGTVKSRLFRARQKLAIALERDRDPACHK